MGKAKEIELAEHRAIVSVPMNAVEIVISCKLLDEKKEPYSVVRTMELNDVWDAFRRAGEGYFYEEDEPHATLREPDDDLALIYLPEDAVFAHLECKCVCEDESPANVDRTLRMVDIRRAFSYADDGYIDEDDCLVLTDKGRELLDQIEKSAAVD